MDSDLYKIGCPQCGHLWVKWDNYEILFVHPEGSFSDDQKTLRELEKIRNKS